MIAHLLLLAAPIQMSITLDAREAPRHILHAHLTIPVPSGPVTLDYPKWLNGTHGPYGPVENLTGLRFTAGGKTVSWKRDPSDLFKIRVDVPQGATRLDVDLDYLAVQGAATQFSTGINAHMTSAQLAILSWYLVTLYPDGKTMRDITVLPQLKLPPGWKFGTSLPVISQSGDTVSFKVTTLEMLIDAPVLAGANFKSVALGGSPAHTIDLAADSPGALEAPKEWFDALKKLVVEAHALFGAHHYARYHFLLALSDAIGGIGWEHHESSDNREAENGITDDKARKLIGSLLPHEFSHSWNGKYRRPAGLTTPDYQQTQQGDLLWVYEGMTTWLGNTLAARAGFWTPEQYREDLALHAAKLDHTPGRGWRPLVDTAIAAHVLYGSHVWESWRRTVDYYPEGNLIWIEADMIIRGATQGKKSLDDFCRAFHGGASTEATVKTYTFDDVVAGLESVAHHDWKGFLQARVMQITPRAPLGGIEAAGWKLVYNEKANEMLLAAEQSHKYDDFSFSAGFVATTEGRVDDVIAGSPAAKAGLTPAMRILAIGGRRYDSKHAHAAITAARSDKNPIEVVAENGDFVRVLRIDYHGGQRWPHLERIPNRPDLLSEMIRPLVK
jgi:predicted metalloprotease with PDZ domain